MIAVLGAGAFGTALACVLSKSSDQDVCLWARDAGQAATLHSARVNTKYLPNAQLPKHLRVTSDIGTALAARTVLVAVPAQNLRALLPQLRAAHPETAWVTCAKGIEENSLKTQSEIIREWREDAQVAALSGPGFADEIARDLPTALTLGAENAVLGQSLQEQMSGKTLRLYSSTDLVGVQLGGALKNVFAIASGILTGAELGESARAALITRGSAELMRLTTKMGAQAETVNGLSGFGDLILTATSMKSRNFAFGYGLAKSGDTAPNKTVEGIATASATAQLAAKFDVDMPITQAVADVLARDITIQDALGQLMARPLRSET